MATTKIWPVKKRLDYVVRYVMAPEKTEDRKLVSAINLLVDTPEQICQDMIMTKQRFGKRDGRQAYHMEQSFAPGEVTPEQDHKIGVEFAQELFGDDFEVVVSTHVDKSHIHNHLVINSVSCIDGHKYHEPNTEYYNRIRKLSDALCKKYHLSVVEEPMKGTARSYPEQHHGENPPHPTIHNIMYSDIDRAIEFAKSLDDFYEYLQDMGYRVKRDGKYPAIAPEGRNFFRLYKFAKGYTEEDIETRINERLHAAVPPPSHYSAQARLGRDDVATVYYGAWRSERDYQQCAFRYHTYFVKRYYRRNLWQTYIQYRYVLRSVQRERYPKYPSPDLRLALRQLNRYSQQATILTMHHIETEDQLKEYMETLDNQAHALNKEKWYLKRELSKAAPEEKKVIEAKIKSLEKAAKPFTREKFLCRDILARSTSVRAQVDREKNEAAREIYKERRMEL